MHKFQFTLDLLRQAIGKAPGLFSADRRAAMEKEARRLADDPNCTREQVEARIIEYGREIWPYRKAFWRIHESEGRPREREMTRQALSESLRAKLDAFLASGGSIEEIARQKEFETFFTPDEKVAIVEALRAAHDRVGSDIEALCAGEKRGVCDAHTGEYRREQEEIERLLAILRGFADRSEKWRAEAGEKVKNFELGWSGVEREVRAEDIRGEIEYYQGIID